MRIYKTYQLSGYRLVQGKNCTRATLSGVSKFEDGEKWQTERTSPNSQTYRLELEMCFGFFPAATPGLTVPGTIPFLATVRFSRLTGAWTFRKWQANRKIGKEIAAYRSTANDSKARVLYCVCKLQLSDGA